MFGYGCYCWRYFLVSVDSHINGLVQDCGNSIVLAMELLQSCTKPWTFHLPTTSHQTEFTSTMTILWLSRWSDKTLIIMGENHPCPNFKNAQYTRTICKFLDLFVYIPTMTRLIESYSAIWICFNIFLYPVFEVQINFRCLKELIKLQSTKVII